MADFARFDEVTVGDRFPAVPSVFAVEQDTVNAFLQATGNDGAAYRHGQAPSMLASVYLVQLLKARNSPPGGIHAKQSIRFHRALQIGEQLALTAQVVEKYVRRDRPYVVSAFEARGGDGTLVASGLVTTIWGRDT